MKFENYLMSYGFYAINFRFPNLFSSCFCGYCNCRIEKSLLYPFQKPAVVLKPLPYTFLIYWDILEKQRLFWMESMRKKIRKSTFLKSDLKIVPLKIRKYQNISQEIFFWYQTLKGPFWFSNREIQFWWCSKIS